MTSKILEDEDKAKGMPDADLIQEGKFPTGKIPPFLVISEIQRRQDMRERYASREDQTDETVAEQIVDGALPPSSLQGSEASRSWASQGSQNPVRPPSQWRGPPGTMTAQAAPMPPPPQMMTPAPQLVAARGGRMPYRRMAHGGMMPYRRMAHGGMIPPNALVEDALKFSPDSLHDVGRAEQLVMLNATNMGIPTVVRSDDGSDRRLGDRLQKVFSNMTANRTQQRFNDGGVVGMQDGSQDPEDEAWSLESVKETGEDALNWIIEQYTDEDGTVNWSKATYHAASVGIMLTPLGWTAKGIQLAAKLPAAYKSVRGLIESRKLIPPGVQANLAKRLAAIREDPVRAAQSVGRVAVKPFTATYQRYPKLTRGAGAYGLAGYEQGWWPFGQEPGDLTREIESDQRAQRGTPGLEEFLRQHQERLSSNGSGLSSGGVIKMQNGGQTSAETQLQQLQSLANQGVPIPPQFQHLLGAGDFGGFPRTRSGPGPGEIPLGPRDGIVQQDRPRPPAPVVDLVAPFDGSAAEAAAEDPSLAGGSGDGTAPIVLSTNQILLARLAEVNAELKNLSKRKPDLPDYKALRASITEGVDADARASILMAIGKSIAEGKGLAGADTSQAQAMRQKSRDAISALELAKAQGKSAKEVADLDREVKAHIAMLGAIPGLRNEMTGMTLLERLQRYRDTLPEGDPDRDAVEKRIAKMTDPSIQNTLAKLLVKQGGFKEYDAVTGKWTTKHGMGALSEAEQAQWNNAKDIGAIDVLMQRVMSESLETP